MLGIDCQALFFLLAQGGGHCGFCWRTLPRAARSLYGLLVDDAAVFVIPEEANEQYLTIDFVQLPHRNHDRFLIIDDKAYLLGASVKDLDAGLCAVTELQMSPEIILGLLK